MATEPWRNPRPAPNLEEVRSRVPAGSVVPRWVRAWWPAIAWSALIFCASTDSFSSDHTSHYLVPFLHWLFPVMTADTLQYCHHIFRKCAHFGEYFIFFLLLYRGIHYGRKGFYWGWGLLAWAIAAIYSLSDEFHQSFVESRGASIWDSLLDSSGALVALLVVYVIYRYFRRSTAT